MACAKFISGKTRFGRRENGIVSAVISPQAVGIAITQGRHARLANTLICIGMTIAHETHPENTNFNLHSLTIFLNADVYNAGPPPVRLFRQLARALRNPAPYGEVETVCIAFQLLARAGVNHANIGCQTSGDLHGIVDHINTNRNKPALNIKYLAAIMKVNRSSLSRLFHRTLGISPSEYIARLRIQNAISMLTGTKKTVSDIASSCGYLDRRYFARLLKKNWELRRCA